MKQKTLKTVQQEESMVRTKVVLMTGAKKKMRLTEKESNRWAFFQPESEASGA